jgi:hypothetical protein
VSEIVPRHQWTHDGAEVLCVKFVERDGSSYGGFKWPLTVGAEVIAPDWNEKAECGGGLHGWPWGFSLGEGKSPVWEATWLVFGAQPDDVVDLDGKVKVRRAVVRYVGDWQGATASRRTRQRGEHWGLEQRGEHWGLEQRGEHWGREQRGEHWAREQRGEHWAREQRGEHWAREQRGEHWAREQRGEHWVQEQRGEHWAREQRGEHWGQEQRGEHWGRFGGSRDWPLWAREEWSLWRYCIGLVEQGGKSQRNALRAHRCW